MIKHFSSSSFRGVDFDGSTVGLANTNAMCTSNSGAVNEVNALVFFLGSKGYHATQKFRYLKKMQKKKKKMAFTFTSVYRTITKTQLEWLLLLRMRWVTTWAYPMTLKTVSAAPQRRKEAASCLRAWGEFAFTPAKKSCKVLLSSYES